MECLKQQTSIGMKTATTLKSLALDMIPVFLAVFLAYQVNEYRDYRKEQKNLEEAAKNIKQEMLANQQQVDTAAFYHWDMIQRLREIKAKRDSGIVVSYPDFMHFLRAFSPIKRNLAIPQLSKISFEAAVRKHAISSMDYETINKVSAVYVNIDEGLKSTQKILLHAISAPDVIALKNFDETFHLLYGSIQELYSQERYLSKQIEITLEHLNMKFPQEE